MPKDKICTTCGAHVEALRVFPGPLCLDCYEAAQEGEPMPTAKEILRMWGM